MIEGVNHLKGGALGFADKRATTDLREFFALPFPRGYHPIAAEKDAHVLLNQNGAAVLDADDN